MAQEIAPTFFSTDISHRSQISDTLVIPSGVTTAILNIAGNIDASNTVRAQSSTDNGQTWAAGTLYSSAQTNVGITVSHGQHWRLFGNLTQAWKTIQASLSVES